MPYLDFVIPITVKDLKAKIEGWLIAYRWELDAYERFLKPTLDKFKGKLINARFQTVLKPLLDLDCWSNFEKAGYGVFTNYRVKITPNKQPCREIHELSVSFTMYSLPGGLLDYDRAMKDYTDRVDYMKGLIKELEELRAQKGQDFIKTLVDDWETHIEWMKKLNKMASKYSVLQYEFDISRYK